MPYGYLFSGRNGGLVNLELNFRITLEAIRIIERQRGAIANAQDDRYYIYLGQCPDKKNI